VKLHYSVYQECSVPRCAVDWQTCRRGDVLLLGFCCVLLNVPMLWGDILHASCGWVNCC